MKYIINMGKKGEIEPQLEKKRTKLLTLNF